jgi:hypothetical protein
MTIGSILSSAIGAEAQTLTPHPLQEAGASEGNLSHNLMQNRTVAGIEYALIAIKLIAINDAK